MLDRGGTLFHLAAPERVSVVEHCDLELKCDALLILQCSLTLIVTVATVEVQKENAGEAFEDLLYEMQRGELKDSISNFPLQISVHSLVCTSRVGW